MKNRIVVTIAGEAKTGKSAIASMLALSLNAGSISVVNEDDAHLSHEDAIPRLNAVADKTEVTIRTRTLTKPADTPPEALNDEVMLAKLQEAREQIDGLTLSASGDGKVCGYALQAIDEVCDEIEDRLAKRAGIT